MHTQSDLINPKSLKICESQANPDDEFEDYTEEEILSEEPMDDVSSKEKPVEVVRGAEKPDDEDSCAEELDEEDSDELEEVLEEYSEDEALEEVMEEACEESNKREPLMGSMDKLPLVSDSNVSSLPEEKNTSGEGDLCEGKSVEEVPCAEKPDDDSCSELNKEDSDEELEEVLEEYSEDETFEEVMEELTKKKPLLGSMDMLPLVSDSNISNLLEEKNTSGERVSSEGKLIEVPCTEKPEEEDSHAELNEEDLDEGLEEVLEEYNEDESFEEIMEEISEELNKKEPLMGSMDKLPLVSDSNVPNFPEEKNTSGERVSSEGKLNEEVACTEKLGYENSRAELNKEDLDEELGEVLEEYSEAESSEEVMEEVTEELNKKEQLMGSMDKPPLVCDSNVPNLPEEKNASGERVSREGKFIEGVPCTEKPDDEDSGAELNEEDSNEELEEVLEEYSEDESFEEIIEEVSEESEEESNKEPLMGSVDKLPLVNDIKAPSLPEEASASDAPQASTKKRRSGWDVRADDDAKFAKDSGHQDKRSKTRWSSDMNPLSSLQVNDSPDHNERRKTRWSSDSDPGNKPGISMLPDYLKYSGHFRKLNEKLLLLNQKLDCSGVVNLNPGESSHSEVPKKKKKLKRKHNFLFKQKLYLPVKEYPNYDFIGLILGPNGLTLKKMERETGATILIQGKGSMMNKKSPHEQDDLHVMIEADKHDSFVAAVNMVKKLLVPFDDEQKHHKASQLREMAEIRTSQVDKTLADKGDPAKQTFPVTVYVGNIPDSVTGDKLKELFLPYGSLCEARVITLKRYGKSRGFGFVKYTSYSDATSAIEKMDGFVIDGHKLRVKVSDEKDLPSKGILPNFPGLNSTPSSSSVFLPSLPKLEATPQSSSNAKMPTFPRLAPIPPASTANLPFSPGPSPTSAPSSNLPFFPGLESTPSSTFLPSLSKLQAFPPSFSNAKMPTFPRLTPIPPATNANLPFSPGLSPTTYASSSNLPIFPGLKSTPSSVFLPTLPKLEASPPSSWNAKIPTSPRLAPTPPASSANLPISPILTTVPSSLTSNLQNFPGLKTTPSSSNVFLPSFPKLEATPSSFNINLPSHATPSTALPSSFNLPSSNSMFLPHPGFSSNQNAWPGPPGSVVQESRASFFSNRYNSQGQSERVPSDGKNAGKLDGKKLEASVLGTPLFQNSTRYTAIHQGIPDSSRITELPIELASFPKYLKSIDSSPVPQSVPSSNPASQQSFFAKNFSGSQMNPNLRSYNRHTAN